MRGLYVSWEFPPQFGGGIGTYVHAISRALAQRGHDITVLTTADAQAPCRETVDGVMVIRLPTGPTDDTTAMGLLRLWQDRSDAVAEVIAKLHQARPFDWIEFPDYRGEGLSWLCATRERARPTCIVRLHTPSSVLFRYNPSQARAIVLEEFEHESMRIADRVVSPSLALVDELRGVLGEQRKIDISPHPVDPAFLSAPASDHSDASREILYVGRFEERKGVETLAAAAGDVLDASPDARLVMIGGDTPKGPGQPSVRDAARGLIAPRHAAAVQFVDRLPREALVERYRTARVCVFPSHFENFPNTCLEAMALGCVVVASDRSGMAEMIDHGRSGFIAKAGDRESLAQAIVAAWRMRAAERTAIGRAARERIAARYAPSVVAEQVERLYARDGADEIAAARTASAPSTSPRVAVVIPCFNHGRFVAEAIASVRGQTYANIEIVVVDDGSTEFATRQELDRVAADGVRVLRQTNAGLAAARNAGVRATDAPFFVALDADDRLDPRFVETLLPPLLADAALGYSYSQVAFFGSQSGGWDCPEYDPRRLLIENLSVATAVVRRAAFDEAGGYSPDMVHGFEDWDFWLALLSLGWHGRMTPARLFHYRKHAGGSMLTETQKRRAEMVQQMIAHHRRLFAHRLEYSLSQKDGQFFREHQHATQLLDALLQSGGSTAGVAADDALYQRLLAQAELDAIEQSRFWRTFERLGLARAPQTAADPRARLSAVKSSAAFRTIQFLKSNFLYRWYAARKYGTPG